MIRTGMYSIVMISALMGLAVISCGEDQEGPVGAVGADGEDDSFSIGKADANAGGFTACELREALEVVNESASTVTLLREEVGIHKQAAEGIVAHRIGPDGKEGTRDDDLFDDLAELDGVKFVGPVALETLIDHIASRCEQDLSKRPFIHKGTFEGQTGGGFGRNAPEFEATYTVSGATGRELYDVVNSTDSRGRTVFSRLRNNQVMEAFTYNFGVDEMPWDSDSVDAREKVPYLALSIESDRYVIDPDDDEGVRELSLGTDVFDDTYYDTRDYELLSLGMVLRGRVRWDDDTTVRRLLVQAKSASSIDERGIKTAAKVDVRTEGSRHIGTLDDDVRSGKVPWSGSPIALEPAKVVWEEMDKAGRLKDVEGFEKVMLLDPKANLRSLRSRFHFNLAGLNELDRFFENGLARVQFIVDTAQAAIDAGTVEDGDKADVEAMIAFGQGILDHSIVTERASSGLMALDPPVDTVPAFPEDFASANPANQHDLRALEIVAEATDVVFAEFEELVDDVDRDITGTRGLDGDDYVDWYITFVKFERSSLKPKRIVKPFLDRYNEAEGSADREAHIAAFNEFGKQQKDSGNGDFEDFEAADETLWGNLGQHLLFETIKTSSRMVLNAGTSSLSQWFSIARKFYVPSVFASTFSNFIIDTFDVTYFITTEEWGRIPEDKRTPANEIEGKTAFHTTLVNEVQIELTSVSPYIDRVDALQAKVDDGTATEEDRAELVGAKFILDESIRTLQVLGELKGDDIVDRLEDEGLDDLDWGPAKFSKGITALRILTDTD